MDRKDKPHKSSSAASMAALAAAAAAGDGADAGGAGCGTTMVVPSSVEEDNKKPRLAAGSLPVASAAAAAGASSTPAAARRGPGGAAGGGGGGPTCQVERCGIDLTDAGRYHRRHKVCVMHSKASVVLLAGLRQRFCQQCSRFHELSEFDEVKRSCRRRLTGHNERRRKSSADTATAHSQDANCRNSDQDGRGHPGNQSLIR